MKAFSIYLCHFPGKRLHLNCSKTSFATIEDGNLTSRVTTSNLESRKTFKCCHVLKAQLLTIINLSVCTCMCEQLMGTFGWVISSKSTGRPSRALSPTSFVWTWECRRASRESPTSRSGFESSVAVKIPETPKIFSDGMKTAGARKYGNTPWWL